MSDERITESEMIIYSVDRGKQTYASDMKRKRRNLGTESRLNESNESGKWGGITVFSIKFTRSSSLTLSHFKICSLTASQIQKVKRPSFKFKKFGSYPTRRISGGKGY